MEELANCLELQSSLLTRCLLGDREKKKSERNQASYLTFKHKRVIYKKKKKKEGSLLFLEETFKNGDLHQKRKKKKTSKFLSMKRWKQPPHNNSAPASHSDLSAQDIYL